MSAELDIAGRVLELVRTAAGPSVEAEVLVDHTALALTRFANSFIHQNVADATTVVRLRVHAAGRTATGSTTLTAADGLSGLVDRTVAAARLCPPDPGWPGLTAPASASGDGNWDANTAQASPAERAELVRAFVAAGGGLEAAGYCRTAHFSAGFANSTGHALTGRTSEAAVDAIVRSGGADGVARLASVRLSELDGSVLGARATAKARAGVDPIELPPGRYEVVFEPTAVSDVLHHLALYGFNGKAVNERRSFLASGTRQFDPAVTLIDDPLDKDLPGLMFDSEGTPKRRLPLIEAGVTRAAAHDRRTAAAVGAEPTGHAYAGATAWGAYPRSMHLAGSPGSPATEVAGPPVDSDSAALVTGVERGLLVTDLWYTRVLDPKSLVVTGLTRNGVWLIEDGRISGPVQNLRFTQSYPQALAEGAVLGVGGNAVTLPSSWGTERWRTPALRLASWNFTGGASG